MGHRNPMAMLNNQRVVGAHQIHRFQIGWFCFFKRNNPPGSPNPQHRRSANNREFPNILGTVMAIY